MADHPRTAATAGPVVVAGPVAVGPRAASPRAQDSTPAGQTAAQAVAWTVVVPKVTTVSPQAVESAARVIDGSRKPLLLLAPMLFSHNRQLSRAGGFFMVLASRSEIPTAFSRLLMACFVRL
jgi:hypothetical protein